MLSSPLAFKANRVKQLNAGAVPLEREGGWLPSSAEPPGERGRGNVLLRDSGALYPSIH